MARKDGTGTGRPFAGSRHKRTVDVFEDHNVLRCCCLRGRVAAELK